MADQFSRLYDVERVGGDQRTRLAELLRSQGMNQPQGQMVSGWYVPPSWSQNLNSALQMGLGTYMGAKIDEEKRQQLSDFLKKYQQGAEVPQEQKPVVFNRLEGMAEGQTPAAIQPELNKVQMLAGRQQSSAEQSNFSQATMPQQQPTQQYRPWTREEKENLLMEAYQIDPRMAGVLGSRFDRDIQEETRKAEKESDRAWREQQAEKEHKWRQEDIRLSAGLSAGRAAEKPLTEYQGQSVLYGTRAAQSNKVLDNVVADPAAVEASRRGGMIGNWLSPANVQQTVQAQRDFINAVLRRESGATISPAEFENANKQYFPQPGDSQEVLAQKKANRDLVIKGFATQAGPSGKAHVMEIYNAPYVSLDNQSQAAPQRQSRLGGITSPNQQGGEWSIRPKQ